MILLLPNTASDVVPAREATLGVGRYCGKGFNMEQARERLRDVIAVIASAEASHSEQGYGDSEVDRSFPAYMERLQEKKRVLTGEVLQHLGLQWVGPAQPPPPSLLSRRVSVDPSSRASDMQTPPPRRQGDPPVKDEAITYARDHRRPHHHHSRHPYHKIEHTPNGAWVWPGDEALPQPPLGRTVSDDQTTVIQRRGRLRPAMDDEHPPLARYGGMDWDCRDSVEKRLPSATRIPRSDGGGGRGLGMARYGMEDGEVHNRGASPSPIPTTSDSAVEGGPPVVVSSSSASSSCVRSTAEQERGPCHGWSSSSPRRPPPRVVVAETGPSRPNSPQPAPATTRGYHSPGGTAGTTAATLASPSPLSSGSNCSESPKHEWGEGSIDASATDAAEGVLSLRRARLFSPQANTVTIEVSAEQEPRTILGKKRARAADETTIPPGNAGKRLGGGDGVVPFALAKRRVNSAVEAAQTTRGRREDARDTSGEDHKMAGGTAPRGAQACRDVGCRRRPIYAFKGDTKALCCPLHRSAEMVNVRHPLCRHESCFRQPSFGMEGDQRATFCSEHKLPEMINVSSRRCEAEGCLRHPNFGFQGDRRATFCCQHKAPGMMDVVSRRCQHDQCVRRPLYAMAGQRAIFCRTHKDPGMTDVVSRRCNFEDGCDRHPSFGWKHADGKARRCAHHRLEGMESVKVNRRGTLKGGDAGATGTSKA